MNTLKLPKLSYYFLCLLATALILSMTPLVAMALTFPVAATGSDQFSPNGVDTGETFTIAVNDSVLWTATGDAPHTVSDDDYTG